MCDLGRSLHARGWPQSVISFHPGGIWRAPIEAADVPRHWFKPARLWPLRRLLRQERPQLLLFWSASKAVYFPWLYGVGRPRGILMLLNDLTVDSETGQPSTILRWLRGPIKRMDYVISNSGRHLKTLNELGVRLPPAGVIYNAVRSQGRARPGEAVPAPRIVGVGSLKPLKAYDVLLQALATLAAEGKDFELVLAGNGPEREPLELLAHRLGIAERVTFLGDVADVPALMATAHIAAHPSMSEGLSNTVLEAMAEGVPVVASSVGAIPEIIQDGQTGLLVPPGSAAPLADAIRHLLEQPSLRARLGQAGFEHVARRLNEETITAEYESLFSQLLRNHPRSGSWAT